MSRSPLYTEVFTLKISKVQKQTLEKLKSRNIKFRGFSKNLTNNEWVYGDLVNYSETEKIIVEQNSKTWDLLEGGTIVNEKSIGQFTGLTDKNGKEIYEGDILKTYPIISSDKIAYDSFNVVVRFTSSSWIANGVLGIKQSEISEVIGNIYKNPELISKTPTHEH